MCIPECNHKVTGNGHEAVSGCEAEIGIKPKTDQCAWALVVRIASAATISGWHFLVLTQQILKIFQVIGALSPTHYHYKVANHGGVHILTSFPKN